MTAPLLYFILHLTIQGAYAKDKGGKPQPAGKEFAVQVQLSQRESTKKISVPCPPNTAPRSEATGSLNGAWATGDEGLSKLEVFLQKVRDENRRNEAEAAAQAAAFPVPIPAPPPPLPRPIPAPPPDRKVCDPCPEPPPPVIHRVPPSRPHGECPGDHEHYFEYHQGPPPECICRLVKETRCL